MGSQEEWGTGGVDQAGVMWVGQGEVGVTEISGRSMERWAWLASVGGAG